jgi:microsomal dipeptidase-like Zn-dependent dipeptidase
LSNQPVLFDLHCHPSLKIYLYSDKISEEHHPPGDVTPFGMCVDLPGMQKSNVKVIFSSHYIPEYGFLHSKGGNFIFKGLLTLNMRPEVKFDSNAPGMNAFRKVEESMQDIESQVKGASEAFNVTIPKNLAEFEVAYAAGKTIILHCIEGGHHLGKELAGDNEYIWNLGYLKKRGLCLMTLSHFFQNDLCDTGGGIPPVDAQRLGYKVPTPKYNGLSPLGEKVVHWCQDFGVIIDLNHTSVDTRKDVYSLLDQRKSDGKIVRPVIFSHNAIRELAEANLKTRSDTDHLLLPDKAEFDTIMKYNGLLGIIAMNYWTNGIEEDNPFHYDGGIKYILNIIDFLTNGSDKAFDYIAIGSDLDGFTQVPDDLTNVSKIGNLTGAISDKYGMDKAEKICSLNALRVLREGWS